MYHLPQEGTVVHHLPQEGTVVLSVRFRAIVHNKLQIHEVHKTGVRSVKKKQLPIKPGMLLVGICWLLETQINCCFHFKGVFGPI